MRRRAAMLERHEAARDADTGKSRIAVAAGRLGGQRTAERHGGGSAWGLRLALKRWHGIPIAKNGRKKAACRTNSALPRGGSDDHRSSRRP